MPTPPTAKERADARSMLGFTATHHGALVDGIMLMLRDLAKKMHAECQDADSSAMTDGTADEWVRKLDTLGNVICASNEDLLKQLRIAGEDAPLPMASSVVIRSPTRAEGSV